MKENNDARNFLLIEIGKCRSCRFCVDVCPTYQASDSVESLSSFGRLQIIKHLINNVIDFDDSLSYCLYSCLQCKRCENTCKSKGQNIEICQLIQLGRSLMSDILAEKGKHAAI